MNMAQDSSKARCLAEWQGVNDPPCHPSDADWKPCQLCETYGKWLTPAGDSADSDCGCAFNERCHQCMPMGPFNHSARDD